jgi:molybdate transport system substrate-binding protein
VAGRQTVVASSSVAGNRLVVVVARETTIGATVDLTSLISDDRFGRIAIADTEAVPAGVYAREALETLGLWSRIEPRLLPTLDVRAALALAGGREADAAFVYSSDAATSDAVRVITTIDASTHSPIEYPLLLLDAGSPQAAELYDFLVSERGRNHFIESGFAAPRGVSF